jgi:Fe-S-cluster containining protein
MMWQDNLRDFGKEIEPGSTFRFDCHPELSCFGMCCSTQITLMPYDIARMRRHLSIDSGVFLSAYCTSHIDPRTGFPFVTLKHKEDGKCVFLGNYGCDVYESRPSCCRNYPLARAIDDDDNTGKRSTKYYLQQEVMYCEGLGRGSDRTIGEYCEMNGLGPYEKANDLFLDVPFAFSRLPYGVRQDREVQSMVFGAVFDFDTFFAKYGLFPHTSVPKDDYEVIVLVTSIALNLIKKAVRVKLKE